MARVARVYVNGVEIGSLPVAQYAQLRRAVGRSPAPYLRTLAGMLKVTACASLIIALLTPLLTVAGAIVLAYADPVGLGALVARVAAGDATPLREAAHFSLQCLILLIVGGLFSHFVFFRRLPFMRDEFAEALGQRARQLLGEPGQGHTEILVFDADA